MRQKGSFDYAVRAGKAPLDCNDLAGCLEERLLRSRATNGTLGYAEPASDGSHGQSSRP